eukprot:UC1_evm4s1245
MHTSSGILFFLLLAASAAGPHRSSIAYATSAAAAAVETCRDAGKQPFSRDSIWNTPVGAGAVYTGVGLSSFDTGRFKPDVNFVVPPGPDTTEAVDIIDQGWWGDPPAAVQAQCPEANESNTWCHCTIVGNASGTRLSVPHEWTTSGAGNHGAAFSYNRTHVVQMQPVYRCAPGAPVLALWKPSHLAPCPPDPPDRFLTSLWGTGTYGAHGGSGLSVLGGLVRRGELNRSAPPIAHALSIELFAHRWYYCGSNRRIGSRVGAAGTIAAADSATGAAAAAGAAAGGGGAAAAAADAAHNNSHCFRWPAITADGYAISRGNPLAYRGKFPMLQPGTLLAVPPAQAARLNATLRTHVAQKLLRAASEFGAYVVDDAAGTSLGPNGKVNINYEDGVAAEVAAQYDGLELDCTPTTQSGLLFNDLRAIVRAMEAVANNAPGQIGGGGTPIAPLPPLLCPQTRS